MKETQVIKHIILQNIKLYFFTIALHKQYENLSQAISTIFKNTARSISIHLEGIP